jgi:tetratricopeptide (TPR) repeat protein
MDKNQDYIEQFLKGELSPEQIRDIDNRIVNDPEFASEMAFHISSIQALRTEANQQFKQRFRTIYSQRTKVVRPAWTYAAAAAVLVCVFVGAFYFISKPSATELADNYINANLSSLGVTMNSGADSMQTAIALYNDGKFPEAQNHFESIVRRAPENYKAIEYCGIVSLRLENYDKALQYFDSLSNATQLYANPGRFYYSLTLLKRNRPGDVKSAKSILQQIVNTQGTNHRAANELLKQL